MRADEQIMKAARCVLAECGVAGFTVDEVASRAGVGKATIYRRWPSRTELLLTASKDAAMDVEDPDTGSLRGDLIEMLCALADKLQDSLAGKMLPSVIAEVAINPEMRGRLPDYMEDRRQNATHVVLRGIARGELPPGTDPDLVLDLVASPLFMRHLLAQQAMEREEIERCVDTVLRGIVADPTTGPDRQP